MAIITDISIVNNIDNYIINHKNLTSTIQGIERCMLLTNNAKEPVNVLLTGDAGTGKTTICKRFLSKKKIHNIVDNNLEKTIIPAFYSSIPSPATIRGVATGMLTALGAPAPARGNALEMTFRLGELLKECNTEVILLDELQHLLKRDLGNSNTNTVKDWIKSCINNFNIPIIIVGTPECEEIINSDNQLSRRFSRRFKLKNFNLNISEKSGEFRQYLIQLSALCNEVIKIKTPVFSTKDESLQVYVATGGNPDDMHKLFKAAICNAIDDSKKTVTQDHFIEAYNDIHLTYALDTRLNPFEVSASVLYKAINDIEQKSA